MLGQSVRLQPVPIQSLSELERARLQEVALYHLDERDLDFKISIPRGTNGSWGVTKDSESRPSCDKRPEGVVEFVWLTTRLSLSQFHKYQRWHVECGLL